MQKIIDEINKLLRSESKITLQVAFKLKELKSKVKNRQKFLDLCDSQFGLAERTVYLYLSVVDNKALLSKVKGRSIPFYKLTQLADLKPDAIKSITLAEIESLSCRELKAKFHSKSSSNSFEIMSSSDSVEWYTPKWVFKLLNRQFKFSLDAAASSENSLCTKFYSLKDNGLTKDWSKDVVYCNPPYDDNPEWFKKFSSCKSKSVVALVPIRAGTKYWFDYVYPSASELFIFKGRLKFQNSNQVAPFDACLILWGKGSLGFMSKYGKVIKLK